MNPEKVSRVKVCMFLNSPLAGDQRVFKEARTLADAGYQVSIICNQEPAEISGVWRGIRVVSVPRQPSLFFPGKFTWDWIRKAISLRPDIIHAHDLNTLGRGVLVSRLVGARLVYDSHDWCTQTPATLRLPWWRRFYSRWKEKLLVRLTDGVIFPVPELCRIASEEFCIKEPVCICNFPRGGVIPRQTILREELGVGEDTRILLYEGVLSGDRGLENIVSSARYIAGDVCIVFVGEGYLKPRLRELARQSGIVGKVKFIDTIAVEKFPLYCAGADAGIVIYKVEGLTTIHGWPTKVFDYLRASLPVLISAGPEITRLVVSNSSGVRIEDISPRGIARAIDDLFSDRKRFEEMRERAVATWQKNFSWKTEEEKLLKLYEQLTEG